MPVKHEYVSPWKLTQRQAEVLDAVIEHGCHKGAARAMGLSVKTIEVHCNLAGQKLPQSVGHIRRYVLWDRWRQSQQKAGEQA